MSPIADQIAGRLPIHRAIRARVFGFAALIVLLAIVVAVLSACGGSRAPVDPTTDPDASAQQIREELEHEQLAVLQGMQEEPREPYWPYRMAEIQVALDSTARAGASLEHALALDPDHTPALLLLSKLHHDAGRHQSAVALLQGALERSTQPADALRMALAINLEALGEQDEAERQLAQCSHDPKARRGIETYLSLRGDAYLESGPLAEAALEADPQSASNHNNYGVALLYEGRPEAARDSFLRALELDPELAGALYNLAIVEAYYFYDLDKGRVWFERYARLEKEDPDQLGAVFGVDLAASAARAADPIDAAVVESKEDDDEQ